MSTVLDFLMNVIHIRNVKVFAGTQVYLLCSFQVYKQKEFSEHFFESITINY